MLFFEVGVEDHGVVADKDAAQPGGTDFVGVAEEQRDFTNGFHDTAADAEGLVVRPRDVQDSATPSGSSMATMVLLRLAALTGVEAISNGVPAFRKPKSRNAATTLLLLGTVFNPAPLGSAPEAPSSPGPPWTARPIPARAEILGDALRRSMAGISRAVRKVEHPQLALTSAQTFFRQGLQLAREGRAPRTSFNRPVGRQHRVLLVRAGLEQARQAAHAHHATVNDVVLCAIAGGARALLAGRGELQRPLALKVSVAASVRAPASASQAGNLVGILLVPLPVGEEDPIRRLEQIARATAERKRLPPYQPAARFLQRWMIRTMNRQRRINLLMSNLPGPPQPLYFAGAKILELFQIGVVQGNVAVQVGALSYAGQLNLDIVADANLVPDLTVFANGMTEDLQRLGASSHERE